MFNVKRVRGVVAGAFVTGLVASPSFAALDKCSKLIDGENLKMQSGVLKSFQKCNDLYRKDALKPPSPPFSKAAAGCESELTKKVLGATGVLSKEITKLSAQVPKTCTDADLIALGHLPTSTFGNRWAQLQGVDALQTAYEQQLITTRDWVNIMATLGRGGTCPSCVKLNRAPCQESSCKLTASSATVNLNGTSISVDPLQGANVLKFCDVSQLISSSSGVYFVLGSPGKALKPAAVGNINTACVKTLGAEGLVQCGIGAQQVSYTQCQDHSPSAPNQAGVGSSGACSGAVCLQTQTNAQSDPVDPAEAPDKLHGGTCITLSATGGSAGDAFINLSSQVGLDLPGGDCTDESKFTTLGTPQISPLTTGSAASTILNADDVSGAEIASDPASGTLFLCSQLAAGQMPNVKLVGAFPALNTLLIGNVLADSVTGFILVCEP